MTDPGQYAYLYDDLPDDFQGLFRIIHNVLIHHETARELYQPNGTQLREKYLRSMQQRLERMVQIDPSPLTAERSVKEKQIGYCRDFAVFLTSILRHKGIPARVRAGFGAYFDYSPHPAYRGDHWVTEYWDAAEEKWRLADADLGGEDLDRFQDRAKHPLKKGLDLGNLRRGEDFFMAADSWLACRAGEIDIRLYRFNAHWMGWPMLRGNLLHDFQALNKLEMGLFDYWDELHAKPESEMTSRDKAILDRIARVCRDVNTSFDEMQALFEDLPRTQMIRSRLNLLGVLSGSRQDTAGELLTSDMSRLLELTGRTKHPNDLEQNPPGDQPHPHHPASLEPDAVNGIMVQGARQNNLKNIDVFIPRNKLVVITGVSGSGKSSLAFDTIYAEGQRRYVESLSRFARQFMKHMEKPQVDKIIGLNPAVAIEQNTFIADGRSTVGSITEVIDTLRLLFARLGRMHCPRCGRAVEAVSAQKIARQLLNLPGGVEFTLSAPLNRFVQVDPARVMRQARKEGFTLIRLDGQVLDLQAMKELPAEGSCPKIEAVIGAFTVPVTPTSDERNVFHQTVLAAVEQALLTGKGVLTLSIKGQDLYLSSENICPACNLTLPKLEPRLLNPNTIFGMCMECSGLGHTYQIDPELIIINSDRSLMEEVSNFHMLGNLRKSKSAYWVGYMRGLAAHYGADLETPWKDLPEEFRHTLLFGSNDSIHIEFGGSSTHGSFNTETTRPVQGAVHHINRLYRQTKSEVSRSYYHQFMRQLPCPQCNGERLNQEARFVSLAGTRFPEVTARNIGELLAWVRGLKHRMDERQHSIGDDLLAEAEQRLKFICDVGLHYLSLDRPTSTLSGGEAQRIRLASQIGAELVGVLYVLDEPSIGLHPRDHTALLDLLCGLRDNGNTVLMVEHDLEAMRRADWLIDMGPGAGTLGGNVIAEGSPAKVMADHSSLTGQYMSGKAKVAVDHNKRQPKAWLSLKGACLHNLKSVDVNYPLGTFICMTGVSGSGKSSLVIKTLYPALAHHLQNAQMIPGPYQALTGAEQLKRVIHVTQAPIGRNPRSNPGTYIGVLDEIRQLFADTGLAKARGYTEKYFSFNVKGGRCEACEGYGANEIQMHFMANVWVRCPECEGKRFIPQILEVTIQGRNIADVLDMDVQTALDFFRDNARITQMLQTMVEVGLGYLRLGQSATTLSGGEAQRVKLAKELHRNGSGDTLYILDEPTTGLHFADIQKLLLILHRLVDQGNTVMVIEHNLDVIKTADWVVDMGPEGGDDGGLIIAQGTPRQVATVEQSFTGQYLKEVLPKD
jgi:excinuclease ABC subunit A